MKSKIHEVKSKPEFFADLFAGQRSFDIRLNDRNYKVGDYFFPAEWEESNNTFTGRNILCQITGVLENADWLQSGYVALSLKMLSTGDVPDGIESTFGNA